MVSTSTPNDPFRADAALVYRFLRDAGPSTVKDLASACFPIDVAGPESTQHALFKRSVRRVLDSIVWMRHQKVLITAVPSADGIEMARFHLGAVRIDPLKVSRVASVKAFRAEGAVSVPESVVDDADDIQDVWHEGSVG
jgi:hypothetical protein